MSAVNESDQASEIYLLRHGRTELNAGGQLRGRLDVPLDEVGLAEAERLGELFASVPLVAVWASPLQRSMATAGAVASRRGLPVVAAPGLADRDYGEWAGRLESEVVGRFGSVDAAPGVEPLDAFVGRAVGALERLVDAGRAAGGPVMAVAHDAVNRAVIAHLVPAAGAREQIPQPTGCWNLLRLDAGRWSAPVVGARPGDGSRPAGT